MTKKGIEEEPATEIYNVSSIKIEVQVKTSAKGMTLTCNRFNLICEGKDYEAAVGKLRKRIAKIVGINPETITRYIPDQEQIELATATDLIARERNLKLG